MRRSATGDKGFTLVELMIVVLIIGVLVSIAIPVYQGAAANARAKSCQANQRTIEGVVEMYRADAGIAVSGTTGVLVPVGGTTWYQMLVPSWIKFAPTCPTDHAGYLMGTDGLVVGDNGVVPGFKLHHQAPVD